MPRPPISGLFDSEIRIWRPITTKDDLKVEHRSYVVVDTVGAAINRSRSPVAPASGGLAPTGNLRWYGEIAVDVQPRDICEIVAGPDAGTTWEVNEIPTRPRNHHVQVDCAEWHGVLQTDATS